MVVAQQEYIIDCAGNKIPVGDKLFSAKCWVGNTTDFLASYREDIIEELEDDTQIPKIFILIPIYRSGLGFLQTLESLLSQNWDNPNNVEILLYVNQPPGEKDAYTQETMSWLSTASSGAVPKQYSHLAKAFVETGAKPKLKILFEQFEGGLAIVYRRAFATLIARIRNAVDKAELPSKEEKVSAINVYMSSTVFCVVDDDLIFPDNSSLPAALKAVQDGGAVALGQTTITSVSSEYPRWNEALKHVMNAFICLKADLDALNLPPRAALLKDLFHLPRIDESVPYADQIWFSSAAGENKKITVPVSTFLQDESYPSNAEMSFRLARYLETGAPEEALQIFENLVPQFKSRCTAGQYTAQDVIEIICALKSRDAETIIGSVRRAGVDS